MSSHKQPLEPAVARTAAYLQAANEIATEDCADALSTLAALRREYESDRFSTIAINYLAVFALGQCGKDVEALETLVSMWPDIESFGCDKTTYHYSMIRVLKQLGRLDDIQSYVDRIELSDADDPLSQLDWIAEYCAAIANCRLPAIVLLIVRQCAGQLLPSAPAMVEPFVDIAAHVASLSALKASANQRYGELLARIDSRSGDSSGSDPIQAIVSDYLAIEPSARFREMAIAEMNSILQRNGGD